MKVLFPCPGCDHPAQASLETAQAWRCSRCGMGVALPAPPTPLAVCAVCGCPELYKKKDFPHWLGLSLLVAGFAGFALFQMFYLPILAFGVLIGTALFDGILYLMVGDAVVCYRCGAHHRGFNAAAQQPFEITIGERYRQQRLRETQTSDGTRAQRS